jgi:hypothetical protein
VVEQYIGTLTAIILVTLVIYSYLINYRIVTAVPFLIIRIFDIPKNIKNYIITLYNAHRIMYHCGSRCRTTHKRNPWSTYPLIINGEFYTGVLDVLMQVELTNRDDNFMVEFITREPSKVEPLDMAYEDLRQSPKHKLLLTLLLLLTNNYQRMNYHLLQKASSIISSLR